MVAAPVVITVVQSSSMTHLAGATQQHKHVVVHSDPQLHVCHDVT